jgi:hypothetical protein
MCLDVDAFLALCPEFASVGGASVGTIEWLTTGTAGQTISIGGVQMTAVSGARTAGTSTWSVDGDAVTEATSFVAAIADSEAADYVTAEKTTPQIVRVTTLGKGLDSELVFATSSPLVYELSGDTLEGGSDLLDFQLAVACSMVNATRWGSKAGYAHAYLTAHLMTVSGSSGSNGGELGVTTSRTIDRISQANAATSFDTSDAAFASTKWGRLYLALKKTVLNIPMMTGARGLGVVSGC